MTFLRRFCCCCCCCLFVLFAVLLLFVVVVLDFVDFVRRRFSFGCLQFVLCVREFVFVFYMLEADSVLNDRN